MYGEGEDGLDAHAGKDAAEKDGMTDLERQVDTVVAAALASPGCLLDAEGAVRIGAPARTTGGGHGKRSKSSRTAHASGSRSRNALASGTSRSRATHASSGSSKDNSRAATSRGSVANSTSGASGAGEGWGEATEGTDIMVARESSRVLSSRALLLSLRTVERAIQQNSYHSRHRLYRAVPGSEQELEQAKADERLRKAAAAGELGDIAEVTRAPAGAWQAQPLLLNPCGTTHHNVQATWVWRRTAAAPFAARWLRPPPAPSTQPRLCRCATPRWVSTHTHTRAHDRCVTRRRGEGARGKAVVVHMPADARPQRVVHDVEQGEQGPAGGQLRPVRLRGPGRRRSDRVLEHEKP